MAYITGSITTANPGADLYTAIAGALTTAGFTLVDTVVISTRTHKVWKSAAANNSAGLDWYLSISYSTTGAGSMWFFPMEFFDPATDLAYRQVFSGTSSTTIDATTYSRWGATGRTLEDSNHIIYPNIATGLQLSTVVSTMGYWISVTGDRIAALTSATPSSVVYSGLFAPTASHATAAGASLFPLIYTAINGSQTSNGSTSQSGVNAALTRFPKASSISGSGWGTLPYVSPAYPVSALPTMPAGSLLVAGSFQLSPILVYAAVDGFGPLGTLIGVGYTTASTVARGDTVTVAGEQWLLATPASSGSIALKAT